MSVDPLQFKYPHYTPYQYAGNKPVSYIDLDGLEEREVDTTSGQSIPPIGQNVLTRISYIDSEGNELGFVDSKERKIFVLSDDAITRVITNSKNGTKFDFTMLTADEAFELPPFDVRQQIREEIDKAYKEMDVFGNPIADFEIGGFIAPYEEYSGVNKIGEGFFNRMRHNGNKVYNNSDQASIPQTINMEVDSYSIETKKGRDINLRAEKWTWHTHLNVFFDKVGNKRSYQWLQQREKMSDTSIKIGADFYSGERDSRPSTRDMQNISNGRIGIVIDMVKNVHFYNNSYSAKLKSSIFFNIK